MRISPFRSAHISGEGLRFTLFGFPIRVQVSFFVVVVLLGLFPGVTLGTMLIWTAVAAVSILWHELGHAFAARRLGSRPTIELYSFGGLTHWQPRADASRWNVISVALAGPVAGLVLGGAVAGVSALAGGFGTDNLRFFVIVVLWVNVGWGLVNLLPVLPLDGGHIMAELLPGTREQRWRRAAVVSVVTGVVAAVTLIMIGHIFGAVIFGWAAFSNIGVIRTPSGVEKDEEVDAEIKDLLLRLSQGDETAVGRAETVAAKLHEDRLLAFKLAVVETAAVSSQGATARRLLETLPALAPPALYALVVVSETFGQRGVNDLEEIFERHPDRLHARWLAFGLYLAGRLSDTVNCVHQIPLASRTESTIYAAAEVAEWAGEAEVAYKLRSLVV